MPTHLDLAGMIAVSDIHGHPEPCWLIEPSGICIASTEGVAQMYLRMFPLIGAMADPEVVNTWFADDGFIGEVRISKPRSDGGTSHSSQFVWANLPAI